MHQSSDVQYQIMQYPMGFDLKDHTLCQEDFLNTVSSDVQCHVMYYPMGFDLKDHTLFLREF
jgi:hypothetical protein